MMGCGRERCDGTRSGDSVMGRDGCEEAVVSWHLITCGHHQSMFIFHRSPELPFGPDYKCRRDHHKEPSQSQDSTPAA